MIHIGPTIRRLRHDQRLAQKDLAEAAGVTASFLSLVENGKRQLSFSLLAKIAEVLEISPEAVIWDAVELPDDLSEQDRRICEAAKLIVRRLTESVVQGTIERNGQLDAGHH